MNFVKSPINYTGNKYRILPQICNYFPKHPHVFVDLFCGGATVGFNVEADKVILIDNNKYVINLLKYLAETPFEEILNTVYSILEKYHLSCSYKYTYKYYKDLGYVIGNNGLRKYNEEGYYHLRKDYNELKDKTTKKANAILYVLMVYGFNNDIRFNSKEEFNLPIGKTDFNSSNLKKLKNYNQRAKEINYEFVVADFKEKKVKEILKQADFLYVDPPYLITTAVYNETNDWNEEKEENLLNLLTEYANMGKQFALSNVIYKKSRRNDLLENWIKQHKTWKVHPIDYSYRSSSYNKKNRDENEFEALITNEVIKNGTTDQ